MNAPASPDRITREETIFNAAVELREPAKRAAYLELACDGDPALRARLEKMLAADADSFFEKPIPSPLLTDAAPFVASAVPIAEPKALSERIGRYKLLQKIGEGGCGVVYLAEQEEPVRRRVALKVIKLGMDTKSVIARFEAERQALALMDHPNIAKVLDAGATDAGRPYFVMELVRGVKITDYCDQQNLSTRERLDLFIKVCQAIQHAHQKGIIHRDIKPSNIIVTLHDGVPVPKVIDFGIAKATTDQRLTDKTLFTALEQFIGTPAYMSPEQAEMSGLDIDTRCDIYSLGVLLYEMLTGQTPFDAKELLASGLDEMRRTIREQEPVRPSTKLSQTLVAAGVVGRVAPRAPSSGEINSTGGAHGVTRPTLKSEEEVRASSRRLLRIKETITLLRGDVDWIVMKCLEKDRARRYETANGLASDIQRHLNNEAVLARPASAAYRFQKLIRRNKLAFTAVTAIATVLVLGIVASTWQAVRATRAKREAVEQRKLGDMQLALQAWEEGDLQRANDLIEASRPAPGVVPAFEWRYLRKLCQDQSIETFGNANHSYRSAQFLDRDSILLNDQNSLTLQDLSSRKDHLLLEDPDGIKRPTVCPGDTNRLATATDGGRIKVWDLAARRVLITFEGHSGSQISDLNFSRDGKLLASAGGKFSNRSDNTIKLWDVELRNPKPIRTLYRYSYGADGVRFSPDGRLLFSSGSERMIRVWDVATGTEAAAPLEGHTASVGRLATSPNGLWLASGGGDGSVIVWNLRTGRLEMRLVGNGAPVLSLAFSPDGRTLASGGRDYTIRLWDFRTGQQLSLLRGHKGFALGLSFSRDGQWLVSHGMDGLVKLWPTTTSPGANALTGSPTWLQDLALSPDGRHVAAVAYGNTAVHLWDLATRNLTLFNGHSSETVICASFSPDGKMLATGSHDQTVKLWDVRDRQTLATLTNGFPVGSLAFSPDGRTLIVGGSSTSFTEGDHDRGGLQFWDVPSLQATGTIEGNASNIVEIALSASGSLLATGSKSGAVSLWDAQTRRLLHRFENQFKARTGASGVISLAFSPTEPLLAASDWGGSIVLFNTTTREVLNPPLKAHTWRVMSLAFSPDGRTLASAGEGGGLKLWNVAARQVALTLKGHAGTVCGVAFSRDNNFLASCGADATVRLWPAAPLEEAASTKTKTKNP